MLNMKDEEVKTLIGLPGGSEFQGGSEFVNLFSIL